MTNDQPRIALLGDYRPGYAPHEQAMTSLTQFRPAYPILFDWVPTAQLEVDAASVLTGYTGIWAGSGPYLSKTGILNGIQFAREQNRPFLGTCSGFGYTVLEFARSQFGLTEVYHPSEGVALLPDQLFLHPLAVCGIGTHEIEFRVRPGTQAHQIYGTEESIREYSNCSYGVHSDQTARLAEYGLVVGAEDETGEAKLLEFTRNDLFLTMLFYPQLNSPANRPHPILTAFVQASCRREE